MIKNSKAIHMAIMLVIIVAIVFTGLMFILRYSVSGETNMPFNISKMTIISTSGGIDINEETMDKEVCQNNDIYIYIEKNDEYNRTETIKSVTLNNFNIVTPPKIGEIKIFKPSTSGNEMCESKEEYLASEINYIGGETSNIKNLEISNQGGIALFRCANMNIGTYTANNDEEVDYADLINKLNINNEDLKAKLSFDIIISLDSEKTYQSNIIIDVPIGDIVSNGTTYEENVNLDNIVFKRIEN